MRLLKIVRIVCFRPNNRNSCLPANLLAFGFPTASSPLGDASVGLFKIIGDLFDNSGHRRLLEN